MSSNFIMNVSDFFKENIPPYILGAFFSRRVFSNNNKYIYVYSFFKKSTTKKIKYTDIDYNQYIYEYTDILNKISMPLNKWHSKDDIKASIPDINLTNGQSFFILKNDLNLNKVTFYQKLYGKLISSCDWIYETDLVKEKKDFIRGFMELRGSIDTTANYIAIDYFCDSELEVKKAKFLIDHLSIPYNVVNFNFREFQKDYYTGRRKRNTQFRLNCWWFMKYIGLTNAYKTELFIKSRGLEPAIMVENVYYSINDDQIRRIKNQVEDRINFYAQYVFNKQLSQSELTELRLELGFDQKTITSLRSSELVDLIRKFTPDECACCKNDYKIEDRSYKQKNNRYYFEIHHVISLGNNKELDDDNNMVKLCPACHRELKKGSGLEKNQKNMIRKIFENEPYTLDFAKLFFDCDDIERIIDLTFKHLK